jgi:hypothetical protein
MKKILSTIALSILLFSCKQENKNTKTDTVEIKKNETEKIVYKKIIENEKLEEFTVSVFQGKNELEGKVELKKDGIEKPFTYTFKDIPYLDLSNVKSAGLIVHFEDFNFDGEKEIVIYGDNGLYIYDRKTGKEKKFFEKEKAGGYAKTGSQNYIFTYRGEYSKNDKEKTITITGACGAGCGVEEIYRVESADTMKLIKKCEWDY